MSADEPIRLLDLSLQNGPLMGAIRDAFERVAASNHFILGPEVQAFEDAASEYLGVGTLGVSSGTDALVLALMALDVGPGDEVITTPFSFFATVGSIVRLGARPVFVDIDPADFNLDATRVEAAITERTKAIIPVHLFGQACDLPALKAICDDHGLAMIEDAAQSLGASDRGVKVGTVGAAGCFSFFPSKTLGCFGDGGLVSSGDPELLERMRLLRGHGARPKYHHEAVGGNFRLDALQAAILGVKLPHVDRWAARRRDNAALYDSLLSAADLPPGRLTPPARRRDGHVFNQYVIRTDRRDPLREHLTACGIGTETYYPEPLHLQPCIETAEFPEGSMPNAERVCREVLALPIYAELTEAQVRRVATAIVDFLSRD